MINILKLDLNKIKYPYIVSLILGFLYAALTVIFSKSGYVYNYNIEIWEQSNGSFNLIFPLLATMPTCWLMYYERKNKFINYTITRVSKKKYILTKWLIASLGGAFLIFLISIFGLILSLYFVDYVETKSYDYALENFFGYYFVNNPFTYGFLLSLWRAFIAFLVVTLGFVISLYIKNIFLILTAPFIYVILENFILASFNMPYYRLVTSFAPNLLAYTSGYEIRLLGGPIILTLFIIFLFIYFSTIKKEKIYRF